MGGTPRSTPETFWARVDQSGDDDCWPWTAGTDRKGYGVLGYQGKTHRAHRLALILSGTEVPAGACVLHSCDNPPCCNPAHLRVGTNYENILDRSERGRFAYAKECKRGHEWKPETTSITTTGSRRCRICEREYCKLKMRARRAAMRAASQ